MIPPDHTIASRIVIRPPNWLGDAVLALPAMVALRAHFATASITVAAVGAVAALFREDTGARPDDVIVLPKSERDVVRVLQQGRFELGILFPNSFGSAWQLRKAGVPQRWGYATSMRGWTLTRRSSHSRLRPSVPQHQIDYYRNLVRGFGIPVSDDPPRITASATGRTRALALLNPLSPQSSIVNSQRLITLAPGAAYGQAKQWPPQRVADVVARLVRDRDATCVLVGAGHDRDAGRTIETWLRTHAPEVLPRVHNVIGRTELEVLVALTAMSRVCVTNDSGVMHVAAATGRPVVAMFGSTDERVTRPIGRGDVLTAEAFCRPCHLRDCPIDHRCMKRITTDQVFSAVSRHLAFRSEAVS
ncbi:MAG: lipopolysaccharide heptosyltransferase II [Acidobacteria bacterium]|nr:lipopolysaccharide heptosyltransferase II [Acidobacteriota bacterium]